MELVRFIWISEQTAYFALQNIKSFFYNKGGECLLRGTDRDLM